MVGTGILDLRPLSSGVVFVTKKGITYHVSNQILTTICQVVVRCPVPIRGVSLPIVTKTREVKQVDKEEVTGNKSPTGVSLLPTSLRSEV